MGSVDGGMESIHHWGEYQMLRHEYATALPHPRQGSLGGTRRWWAEARTPGQGHALNDLEPQSSVRRRSLQAQKSSWPRPGQATRPNAKMARTTAPCERQPLRNCPTDPKRGNQTPHGAWNDPGTSGIFPVIKQLPSPQSFSRFPDEPGSAVPCPPLLRSREEIRYLLLNLKTTHPHPHPHTHTHTHARTRVGSFPVSRTSTPGRLQKPSRATSRTPGQ